MKILITGYGKMGRMVEELAQQKGWEILAALDGQDAKLLRQLKKADAAVDFSHPAMLDSLANYIRRTGTPLISGTTGYSEEQMDVLRQLGKSAAVLYSANYSLGVALLRRILENFGPMLLADFDVELVESTTIRKQMPQAVPPKCWLTPWTPTGDFAGSAAERASVGPETAMKWACLPCVAAQWPASIRCISSVKMRPSLFLTARQAAGFSQQVR